MTASAALNNLGLVAWWSGDDDQAIARYEEALAISRRIGDDAGAAATQVNLAGILRTRDEAEAAQVLCREALELFARIGDVRGRAMALHNLGSLAAEQGDLGGARLLYERSLAIRRGMADRPGAASSACALALVCVDQGDLRGGRELLRDCLDTYEELESGRGTLEALEGFVRLAAAADDQRGAAVLAGYADAAREALGECRAAPDQAWLDATLAEARGRLGADRVAAALDAGRRMTPGQAGRVARAVGLRGDDATTERRSLRGAGRPPPAGQRLSEN